MTPACTKSKPIFKVYELSDSKSNSWLKVVPERGGIITSFGVEGEEFLFLNEETLYNRDKNIRGGIPILFPISGQLDNGEYEWNGTAYKMKNHGVARNHPWEVVSTKGDEEQASITLCFKSNDETKIQFPFDFELIFTYTLTDGGLTIYQQYINHTESSMPMYPGFHPYFRTTHKDISYVTDAKTYLDYNDMSINEVTSHLDLNDKKESFALLDATKKEISFELPDRKKTITLAYGDEFKYVVLWTEKDQDFVCVEPWLAKTNELNRKEELVIIYPQETLNTTMSSFVK